jgi:sulfur carrier protein ThiS
MRIRVVYLGVVRHKVGRSEDEYEVRAGSSLNDLLAKIAESHIALRDLIGGLGESPADPTLIVALNGSAVNPAKSGDVTLKDGDVLTLMTVIGGG